MGYNQNQGNNGQKSGYDRNLDNVIAKIGTKVGNRYLNCVVYSYNNGPIKIRISPCSENTNPNAESNKKWINSSGISAITKEEAQALIINLQKAISEM